MQDAVTEVHAARWTGKRTWFWMRSLTRSMGAAAVLETAAETPPTVDVRLVGVWPGTPTRRNSSYRQLRGADAIAIQRHVHRRRREREATYSKSRPRSRASPCCVHGQSRTVEKRSITLSAQAIDTAAGRASSGRSSCRRHGVNDDAQCVKTHMLLSAACAEQADVHLRDPHLRLDASMETFPCHRALSLRVLELVMIVGLDAT